MAVHGVKERTMMPLIPLPYTNDRLQSVKCIRLVSAPTTTIGTNCSENLRWRESAMNMRTTNMLKLKNLVKCYAEIFSDSIR